MTATATIAPTWPPPAVRAAPEPVASVLQHLLIIPPLRLAPQAMRDQTLCLALAMYHEARGAGEAERIAVAQVIANRAQRTGASICATIWADRGSQFQWVKGGITIMPRELTIWQSVQNDAVAFIAHRPPDLTRGATLFYNPALAAPNWIKRGAQVTLCLHQVFLRETSDR